MTHEIITSLISSSASIIVAVVSIILNNRLLGYKVDELRKDVEKHNQLVERTAVIERDVKTAFNKIDENREDIKEVRGLIAGK